MTRHPYVRFTCKPQVYKTTLERAMKQYPNASSFTVVATNTEGVLSFVPNHLTRFIPESTLRLLTMDYPRDTDPLTALEREADKLAKNIPNSFVLDDIIGFTMDKQTRITKFQDTINIIAMAKKYTPELVPLVENLHKQSTEQFYARVKRYVREARKQHKSINILTDNETDIIITLNGKPLDSTNVVWEWLRLTHKEADALSNDDLQAKQKRLYDLNATVDHLLRCIQQTDVILPFAYLNYRQKIKEARTRKKKKGNNT